MSRSALPATQNDMTTCLGFQKEMFCSLPHRHGDATGKPETRDKICGYRKNQHFVRDFLQFLHVRHVIKQVGMSQSATPAKQNDMTTCVETFENERFCGFPHRHGETTGKPETRDEEHHNEHFVPDILQFSHFETCRRDMFCSFPHRHGETTIKPMTRDETGGSTKTSISCETSSNFHTL